MRVSPAKQHKQRVQAKKTMVDDTHGDSHGSAYELLCLQMIEDKRTLKALQSIKAKISKKTELLPNYDDWIQATLEHGTGKVDKLLGTLMLWHIDTGNFDTGLSIGEYMLKHEMTMPDTYKRTIATVIAEEVADTAKRLFDEGVDFDVKQVLRASTITEEHDMHDQVRAKLAKIIGKLLEEDNPEQALEHYQKAFSYNPKAGVTTAINRLKKQVEKEQQTPPSSEQSANDDNQDTSEDISDESSTVNKTTDKEGDTAKS